MKTYDGYQEVALGPVHQDAITVANWEERRVFWRYVAAGMSSEAAAVKAGASQPDGSYWFREERQITVRIQGIGEALVRQILVAGRT